MLPNAHQRKAILIFLAIGALAVGVGVVIVGIIRAFDIHDTGIPQQFEGIARFLNIGQLDYNFTVDVPEKKVTNFVYEIYTVPSYYTVETQTALPAILRSQSIQELSELSSPAQLSIPVIGFSTDLNAQEPLQREDSKEHVLYYRCVKDCQGLRDLLKNDIVYIDTNSQRYFYRVVTLTREEKKLELDKLSSSNPLNTLLIDFDDPLFDDPLKDQQKVWIVAKLL